MKQKNKKIFIGFMLVLCCFLLPSKPTYASKIPERIVRYDTNQIGLEYGKPATLEISNIKVSDPDVTVTGFQWYKYDWKNKKWNKISGETSRTYTVDKCIPRSGKYSMVLPYRCDIKLSNGKVEKVEISMDCNFPEKTLARQEYYCHPNDTVVFSIDDKLLDYVGEKVSYRWITRSEGAPGGRGIIKGETSSSLTVKAEEHYKWYEGEVYIKKNGEELILARIGFSYTQIPEDVTAFTYNTQDQYKAIFLKKGTSYTIPVDSHLYNDIYVTDMKEGGLITDGERIPIKGFSSLTRKVNETKQIWFFKTMGDEYFIGDTVGLSPYSKIIPVKINKKYKEYSKKNNYVIYKFTPKKSGYYSWENKGRLLDVLDKKETQFSEIFPNESFRTNCERNKGYLKAGKNYYFLASSRENFYIGDNFAVYESDNICAYKGYHTYGFPTFNWSSDYEKCTLSFSCVNCKDGVKGHTKELKCSVSKKGSKVTAKSGSYQNTVTLAPSKSVPSISLKSVTSKNKKAIKVTWNTSKNIDGYEIQYSTDKSFKKSVKQILVVNEMISSKTIKKLKSNSIYYVRIRGISNTIKKGNTSTSFSKWSSVKKVKCK